MEIQWKDTGWAHLKADSSGEAVDTYPRENFGH
jgi:hypothetical protein